MKSAAAATLRQGQVNLILNAMFQTTFKGRETTRSSYGSIDVGLPESSQVYHYFICEVRALSGSQYNSSLTLYLEHWGPNEIVTW